MAEKEGWSKEKVFNLLKDPAKLVKTMEHVRYHTISTSFLFLLSHYNIKSDQSY